MYKPVMESGSRAGGAIARDDNDTLNEIWAGGYSIAELWGNGAPVQRATSAVNAPHCLLWGILSIADQQLDKGSGGRYFNERLKCGDWIAIGFLDPRSESGKLAYVPRFEQPKFGRKSSAIGDGCLKYVDVRVVHATFHDTVKAEAGS